MLTMAEKFGHTYKPLSRVFESDNPAEVPEEMLTRWTASESP